MQHKLKLAILQKTNDWSTVKITSNKDYIGNTIKWFCKNTLFVPKVPYNKAVENVSHDFHFKFLQNWMYQVL